MKIENFDIYYENLYYQITHDLNEEYVIYLIDLIGQDYPAWAQEFKQY